MGDGFRGVKEGDPGGNGKEIVGGPRAMLTPGAPRELFWAQNSSLALKIGGRVGGFPIGNMELVSDLPPPLCLVLYNLEFTH